MMGYGTVKVIGSDVKFTLADFMKKVHYSELEIDNIDNSRYDIDLGGNVHGMFDTRNNKLTLINRMPKFEQRVIYDPGMNWIQLLDGIDNPNTFTSTGHKIYITKISDYLNKDEYSNCKYTHYIDYEVLIDFFNLYELIKNDFILNGWGNN